MYQGIRFLEDAEFHALPAWMRIIASIFLGGVAGGLASGCASDPRRDGLSPTEFASVERIAIYDESIAPWHRFQVLDRVEGTSCNLTGLPPRHPRHKVVTEYEALYDMKLEAADLGANAIVDVSCKQYGYGLSHSCYQSVICEGDAVRLDDGVGMDYPVASGAGVNGVPTPHHLTASPAIYESLVGFTPDYLTESQRATLGDIGVAMPDRAPGSTVEAPPSGKNAAAHGAGMWFLQCVGQGGSIGLIISPLCAAIGAGLGAFSAEDPEAVKASNEAIGASLREYYSHEALRDRMVRVAAQSGAEELELQAAPPGGELFSNATSQWHFHGDVDTVIEVAVEELLIPAWNRGAVTNLPTPVSVRTRVRVIRLADSRELYNRTYGFVTDKRKFTEWGAENGAPLRHALERGFERLAEQIIEDLLLAYPLMPTFGAASQGRYGGERSYVIEPVEPEPHRYWSTDAAPRPTQARSLQPRFRWRAFPSAEVLHADFQRKLATLTDLRYDLRIYRLQDERHRARLVLERNNMEATEYLVTQPLAPDADYAWSVRARFVLDTGERTTRWSGDWLAGGVKGFLFYTPR